ncbi:MAG: MBL fold metallo-hydrolase [Spirochaetales bacterium]|nr:MAG: MBL fold metallo-hydrolase [Spirochaetales bacterium]
MAIRLYSYGAAEEVTGSRHILDTGTSRIMVDCGAFQGRRQEADEKNRTWDGTESSVSATVLTHAHFDHCGLLPLLCKKGYKGNIYSTAATRDLANLILMDSAKIQDRDAEYLRKQAARKGEKFTWEPLYREADVIAAMEQFVTVSYKRPIFVSRDAEVTFYDAGHILGSSLARFSVTREGGGTIDIGFSGDLGRKNKPIIRDPSLIPPVDYLVLESTYGDRLHEPADDILNRLAQIAGHAVKHGGKLIIPAFAVERTQDLVFYLHLLSDQKRIQNVPIFVDSPMAVSATAIFKLHPECYDEETRNAFTKHHANPFGFNNLTFIENVEASKKLNDLTGPAIIISSSGMCEAGRILHHLAHTIADPKNIVLIVGFMAKDTLGRKIRDRERQIKILGETYIRRAEVEEIGALSSHADYNEIWEYVSGLDLKRLKKIFLVHGEHEAQAHLQEFLLGKGVQAVDIVKRGETYELN